MFFIYNSLFWNLFILVIASTISEWTVVFRFKMIFSMLEFCDMHNPSHVFLYDIDLVPSILAGFFYGILTFEVRGNEFPVIIGDLM